MGVMQRAFERAGYDAREARFLAAVSSAVESFRNDGGDDERAATLLLEAADRMLGSGQVPNAADGGQRGIAAPQHTDDGAAGHLALAHEGHHYRAPAPSTPSQEGGQAAIAHDAGQSSGAASPATPREGAGQARAAREGQRVGAQPLPTMTPADRRSRLRVLSEVKREALFEVDGKDIRDVTLGRLKRLVRQNRQLDYVAGVIIARFRHMPDDKTPGDLMSDEMLRALVEQGKEYANAAL